MRRVKEAVKEIKKKLVVKIINNNKNKVRDENKNYHGRENAEKKLTSKNKGNTKKEMRTEILL